MCLWRTATVLDTSQEELGFEEIESSIKYEEVRLSEDSCKEGLKRIKNQYRHMIYKLNVSHKIQRLTAINDWRNWFRYHKSTFTENKKYFQTKYLKNFSKSLMKTNVLIASDLCWRFIKKLSQYR